jgi:hypothetical protein
MGQARPVGLRVGFPLAIADSQLSVDLGGVWCREAMSGHAGHAPKEEWLTLKMVLMTSPSRMMPDAICAPEPVANCLLAAEVLARLRRRR